jgi:uncharacterized protein
MQEFPEIVAFVADLYFVVQIESVAQALGFRVHFIENADQVAPPDPAPIGRQYAEHVTGRSGALLDQLTLRKPALIIFDLDNPAVPWEEWIRLITSVPATRRIPVLCYGSHVQVDAIQAARAAGAKEVVARSRFTSNLSDLIFKHARTVDRAALAESCSEPLAPSALRGLEEFNRGEYFEAHESLEAAWMADTSAGRDLYQAVLQVAVAYYQIRRGNFTGAAKMFLRMRQWIDPLPDTCRGVNVARLRSQARAAHQVLMELGPERIGEFDLQLLQPVEFQAS